MMNWYLVLLFSFLGYEIKTWSNAEMDWDNEQICHWLTAVGLGEYVQRYVCQTRHHRKGIVCFRQFRFSFWLKAKVAYCL